jgi:anti-sigma factor RsiW
MTMSCQDILERLVEGVTGSVPPAERTAVLEHLATCPQCRREAAELEGTVGHLRAAGAFTTPPGFWGEFMERLSVQMAHERLPVMLRLRRWLAAPRHAWGTALVTAAAAIVISTMRPPMRPTATPDPLSSTARGLVTETMTTTLPSLGEMLDVWRAGLATEGEPLGATEPRP